jgi:hypothetical protein
LTKKGFESFAVYMFSMDYPEVCRIEFNPKSMKQRGDVVFHFPDREKMFVSWGKLDVAQKKFATLEEQAEKSLKAASKSTQTKTMERIKKDSIEVNSHKAIYNHVRMEETSRGFFPSKHKMLRDVLSIHLHCEPTSRYFVLYAMPTRNAPEDFGDLFLDMADTFECHPTGH